jgi:hypothetical protein
MRFLPEDLRRIEMQISNMVQHENELLNHRIQWFLTLNGFLFTAVALYGNQPGRNWFGWTMAGIGLLVCYSFSVGLRIGGQGFKRLVAKWKEIRNNHSDGFVEIGVYGHLADGFIENHFAPWRALPVLMATGWIVVAIFVWHYPGQNPTGTFSPILIQEQKESSKAPLSNKTRIRLYDTRSGRFLNRESQ